MKRFITLLFLAIIFGGYAMAYDFSAECSSGQTLYYKITSNEAPYTVELTSEYEYGGYGTAIAGELVIPETVEYNSITYSVISIGEYAFRELSGLTSVAISNSVTSIGNYAFWGCSGLTEVTIGNSVMSIGDYAFSGCSGLETVNFNATNCTNMAGDGGVSPFDYCDALTTVNIGSNVTNIPDYAFLSCSIVGDLIIPNSVTSIGRGAFSGCELTSVTIPNSIIEIGDYAFQSWNGEHSYSVYYSGSIAQWCGITFGAETFDKYYLYVGNNLVTDLVIPETVSEIKSNAFYNAINIEELTISNTLRSIGASAFSGTSLSSVIIPNSVERVGSSAFYDCENLTSVFFNVRRCDASDEFIFAYCPSLSVVTLGEDVTVLPNYMFYESFSMDTIYSLAVNPPELSGYTFDPQLSLNIPVIVPCGTVSIYSEADFWYNFRRIQQAPGCGQTYTITVLSNNNDFGSVSGGGIYQEQTQASLTATPETGYTFLYWSDGSTENPHSITVTSDATYIATFVAENGIDESAVSKITIFPNPATDLLNITSSETISGIEIVNVMGQVVKRMEGNSDNAVCDVEELTAGVYVVRIHTEGTVVSQRKFVKE